MASSKLKKVQITNVLVNFLSVCPLILPESRSKETWLKRGDGGNRGTVLAPHEGYIPSQISQTPDQGTKPGCTRIPNVLKVKWDVKAKGQICVDGRKQRKNVVPVEATSPTVSTESILITEKLMGMRDTTLGYSTSRLIFSVQTWTRT